MKNIILFLSLSATAAFGGVITPGSDGGPYCLSPVLGAAACSITNEYAGSGLIFSQTAVFDDPPMAWGGINASGVVDLLAPVVASFVVPGTLTPGVTDYLSVEAGYSSAGALRLSVYDIFGNLLGTRLNGLDGIGPNGRSLITLNIAGIHSFSVDTPASDEFGVNQIDPGTIQAAGAPVPEPGTFLLTLGLLPLAFAARRRR